jgi:flagellar biosynthesis/type III secretory pathway protein FliH
MKNNLKHKKAGGMVQMTEPLPIKKRKKKTEKERKKGRKEEKERRKEGREEGREEGRKEKERKKERISILLRHCSFFIWFCKPYG